MADRKDLSRRRFLKTGAAAAAAVGLPHIASAAAPRPNVLLILTDQQNIDTIAAHRAYFNHPAHGCAWVKTPHLDRLAGMGTSFLESHVANPVCSPSRSCLFTGRVATETAVVRNNVGIDLNVPNLGQWLGGHSDYFRVYCGKWHAGGPWNYPEVSGARKIPGFEILPAAARGTGDVADYAVTAAVEAFVRNYRASAPFFAVASLMNPHDICYWTEPLLGKAVTPSWDVFGLAREWPVLPPNHVYDFEEPVEQRHTAFDETRWRNYTYDYYRMIEKVDADVGRLLDAVEARNDDTLVIFTSDHGEGLGRHGRVQKWHPYEESIKVPLIVALPGRVAGNRVDASSLVSQLDIVGTICDFAGIAPPPHARGESLRPLLETDEPPQAWRNHVYAEWQVTGRVIRSNRYKYVKSYAKSGDDERPFVTHDGAAVAFDPARTDTLRVNPKRLLFDMREDPWETRNLIAGAEYAGVVNEHEALLREWEMKLIPGVAHTRG